MKRQAQVAVPRLVLGSLWLVLTGGCTAATTLQSEASAGTLFNLLSLTIGSLCTAPAVWLVAGGLRVLLGPGFAIGLLCLATAVALVEGAVLLVESASDISSAGELLFVTALSLGPAIVFGAWTIRSWCKERRRSASPGSAFD